MTTTALPDALIVSGDRLWIALPVACMYCHVSVSYASIDERELTGASQGRSERRRLC